MQVMKGSTLFWKTLVFCALGWWIWKLVGMEPGVGKNAARGFTIIGLVWWVACEYALGDIVPGQVVGPVSLCVFLLHKFNKFLDENIEL
jgi:hypothetical protein